MSRSCLILINQHNLCISHIHSISSFIMKLLGLLGFAALAAADKFGPLDTQKFDVTPPPGSVTIKSISYGGSGCPQGTVGSFISADRTTYTLIFDSYIAEAGPGKSLTASRKNCQINVDIHYPAGYQYSLYSQNYRGFVNLDAGVRGVQQATFYFSGSAAQASTTTNFAGPANKDYLITDTIPFSSQVLSPCGQDGALNINTQIRVDNSANPSAHGQLTTDSIDGKVELKFGLAWKQC
jgi:hypothetical protein